MKDIDINGLKETLISLFASIPNNNYTNKKIFRYEGYYASVIYTYLASLGFKIIGEDVTNLGRIDLTLFIKDKIYIIEFKVGAESAIEQIKAKNYAQKYLNKKKDIVLVGINFDIEIRNVSGVEWEFLR